MKPTGILSKNQYQKLIRDLRGLIQASRGRAEEAVADEKVRLSWEIGRRISKEQLTDQAGYRMSVYRDVAKSLDRSVRTIRQCASFFKTFPQMPPRGHFLRWSHYRELSLLPDARERKWYKHRAQEKKWPTDSLVRAIKGGVYRRQLTNGKSKRTRTLKRPKQATYVYKTEVLDVVDGDTLRARMDLGFTVDKRLRLRLAQIDCPSIKTRKGREAFEFVRDRLARVPFIVIRTTQIDLHGRYVADVFYSLRETKAEKVFEKGNYLNQELVRRGLANVI